MNSAGAPIQELGQCLAKSLRSVTMASRCVDVLTFLANNAGRQPLAGIVPVPPGVRVGEYRPRRSHPPYPGLTGHVGPAPLMQGLSGRQGQQYQHVHGRLQVGQ